MGIKLPKSNSSTENLHFCKCCGATIEQRIGFKPRLLCSDACRKTYWNSHQEEINRKTALEYNCPVCGKAYSDYAKHNRKCCSHECYIISRFKGGVSGSNGEYTSDNGDIPLDNNTKQSDI